jgi:hypothetical protein
MDLHVHPIPVDPHNVHPPPPHEALMQHEHTIGFVAPKGSGKTTTMCNLLLFNAGYFHTILVFGPTIKNDDKWQFIKQQRLLGENTDLKEFLLQIRKKNDTDDPTVVVAPPPYEMERQLRHDEDVPDDDTFTGKIPESHFMTEYDESKLAEVLNEQQQMIDFLEAHGKSRHLANRILLLFDDLVGSSLFSNKRQNLFKILNTIHRHLSVSIWMVTQAYKEVPKTVRTQYSGLVLFEIPNEQELLMVYAEHPMGLKKGAWMEVYKHAVADEYSFLYIK